MYHPLCRQPVTSCYPCFARGTASQGLALLKELRASSPVYCPVDPAASQERVIGCVHYRIHFLFHYVAHNNTYCTLVFLFLPEKELGYKDGFAIVVLSWVGLAFLGALPYLFSGKIPSFIDCYFESMSGFTTTGSTILSTIEILPHSLLFWRALTHWIGGMGIIVLTLAILPLLGIGGMQLFQAEMPGPTKDRLAPRIQDTARILWSVYVLLTIAEIVLLMLGGVDFFNAMCHSFATLATGGFSNHSLSVAYYNSAYVEGVVIFFMFLAGINFSLHFHFLRGRLNAFWQNEEFRLLLVDAWFSLNDTDPDQDLVYPLHIDYLP